MPASGFEFADEPWQPAAPAGAGEPDAPGTAALCGFHHFAVAAVLSGGAGIRATMPAFLLGLFHQLDAAAYPLSPEFAWLARPEVCVLMGLFMVVEILADSIPAVDHALHAILVPAHPVAGGALALAPAFCGGALVKVPMAAAGAALAGGVHVQKAMFRATLSSSSGGCLNTCVSTCESVAATVAVVMSILNPTIAGLVTLVLVGTCVCAVCSVARLCGWGVDEQKPGPGPPGRGFAVADREGAAMLNRAPSAPQLSAMPARPAELSWLLASASAEAESGAGGLPQPNGSVAEAAFEVERILACPSLGAVLGGGGVEERRREFRRLILLLHPDKGLAFGPRAAAALQRAVEANAALNGTGAA